MPSYCAARFRRNAANTLAVLMLLVVIVMMVATTERPPLWYQFACFVLGTAAASVGGILHSRRQRAA